MPQPTSRQFLWIFVALVAAFCLWVLQLPMFPMQDGPMHLYLARVMGSLLGGNPSIYSSYYAIQHLLPPYSLHYYLLIILMKFLPALWAEKVVVCLILITFCFGIRYLAMATGPAGNIFSFFCFAIALNWPLMMGFQNYVLSLALACWALGLWSRASLTTSIGLRALFVGLCALAAITHPLPLLLILAFAGADIVLRALSFMSQRVSIPAILWVNVAALACAATLLLYLRAFTDSRRSAQDFHASENFFTRAHYFIGLHGLYFFGRNSIASHLLQFALYLILAICVLSACSAFFEKKTGTWNPGHTWLCITILFTCALPFLPDDLSGSKALVSRLQIVTFIGFIAAASALPRISIRMQRALIAFAAAAALGTLALAQSRLAPIARRIASIDHAAIPFAGTRGLLLSAGAGDQANFAAATYAPLLWQAASYFARSNAVLLNTPWMDSTWLPLTSKPGLLTADFTPWTMECYHCLRQQLIQSASVRDEVFPRTDFIVFVDQPGSATQAMLDQVLKADPQYQWSCQQHDWLWLCHKLLVVKAVAPH